MSCRTSQRVSMLSKGIVRKGWFGGPLLQHNKLLVLQAATSREDKEALLVLAQSCSSYFVVVPSNQNKIFPSLDPSRENPEADKDFKPHLGSFQHPWSNTSHHITSVRSPAVQPGHVLE